ncbi:PAS domain S-box-containing protein [Scopulibacillus darangshiensis]|uniref:histidine kinase n=1 Tax=Scopulibacillus darangshiensis TaxID=442528 RepID=A0A4R2P2T6_9BACL|nr:PAS domain S-box-containing protein [Scopulibacillus darangshiensis]
MNQRLFKKCHTLKVDSIEIHSYLQESFFHCLGEALCVDEKKAFEKISVWSAMLLNRATQFDALPEIPLFPDHLYRSVLFTFMEEEINHNHIPPAHLIQIVKRADCLIHYASTFFVPSHFELLHDSPDEESKITLGELCDLMGALKEATILTITDKDDNIKYANDKFCQITKYSSEELIGQNHAQLLSSSFHNDIFFRDIRAAIKGGRVWKGDICNKAKDGSIYWVDTTIVPFLDSKGETYQHIAIQHDITEQKNTENMLHKTEQLSMVGELAAGIAHEIRNPLTTIRGFVQILDSFTGDRRFQYSKVILDEIDRINFIVSEFMVFAKPHTVHFSVCNMIAILKSVSHLMEPEAALKNVKITHDFSNCDIVIYGEKNQLTQVFMNMIKNSIDALPDGGQIKLSIKLRDNEALVTIQDNGLGMTEEQVNKIGEPFYTTKAGGNGLGLMVSYKIIDNHHGRIMVESELNKGTTFLISFPLLK